MTKKSGRPLVTGLVGVSTITCREKSVLLTTGFQAAEENAGNRGKRVLGTLGVSHSPAEEGGKEGAHEKDQHRQSEQAAILSPEDHVMSLGGKKPFQK